MYKVYISRDILIAVKKIENMRMSDLKGCLIRYNVIAVVIDHNITIYLVVSIVNADCFKKIM